MNFAEFEEAVDDARAVVRRGDEAARRLARLLVNRLRVSELDHWTLKDLKRELDSYNVNTRKWKDKQP